MSDLFADAQKRVERRKNAEREQNMHKEIVNERFAKHVEFRDQALEEIELSNRDGLRVDAITAHLLRASVFANLAGVEVRVATALLKEQSD